LDQAKPPSQRAPSTSQASQQRTTYGTAARTARTPACARTPQMENEPQLSCR
ncbi:hypothetical protein CLAFUW4_12194, partial [Fulvia fulva]